MTEGVPGQEHFEYLFIVKVWGTTTPTLVFNVQCSLYALGGIYLKKRTRNYGSIIYPESAPENWREILEQTYIPAIVSPLHDRDIDDAGAFKKEHYHLLLMFDSVKTIEQASSIIGKIGGVGCEVIHSARGYARYLCHMDNPDKFQYSKDDVTVYSGADYETLITLPESKYDVIADIIRHCKEFNVVSFSEIVEYSMESKREWFRILCDSGAIIKEYLKSKSWTVKMLDDVK